MQAQAHTDSFSKSSVLLTLFLPLFTVLLFLSLPILLVPFLLLWFPIFYLLFHLILIAPAPSPLFLLNDQKDGTHPNPKNKSALQSLESWLTLRWTHMLSRTLIQSHFTAPCELLARLALGCSPPRSCFVCMAEDDVMAHCTLKCFLFLKGDLHISPA